MKWPFCGKKKSSSDVLKISSLFVFKNAALYTSKPVRLSPILRHRKT
jgi:hypothetical protein